MERTCLKIYMSPNRVQTIQRTHTCKYLHTNRHTQILKNLGSVNTEALPMPTNLLAHATHLRILCPIQRHGTEWFEKVLYF